MYRKRHANAGIANAVPMTGDRPDMRQLCAEDWQPKTAANN